MNWFRSESNSRNYLRAVSRSLTTGGRWSNSGRYLVISSSYKLVLLFVQSAGMISLHDSVGFRSDYLVFSFFFIYLFFIVMMMMMITEKKEKHFGTVATHYCVEFFFQFPTGEKKRVAEEVSVAQGAPWHANQLFSLCPRCGLNTLYVFYYFHLFFLFQRVQVDKFIFYFLPDGVAQISQMAPYFHFFFVLPIYIILLSLSSPIKKKVYWSAVCVPPVVMMVRKG